MNAERKIVEASVREEYPPVGSRLALMHFDKIVLATASQYLVKGFLPREGLVVVWGSPKCGK